MGIFDKIKQIFKPKENSDIPKPKISDKKLNQEDELNKEIINQKIWLMKT